MSGLGRGSWTVAVAGPAPAEVVWQRYVDVGSWPDWSPPIRAVTAGPRLVTGLSGTVLTPARIEIPFTVLEVDPLARRWSWRVGPAGLGVVMDHEVVLRADGSVATLTVHAPRPLAFGYGQLARVALHRLVH